jgi:hypothetical protein
MGENILAFILDFQDSDIDKNKVLFATSYGHTKYMLAVETTLAYCLKIRGLSPYFFVLIMLYRHANGINMVL